MSIYYILIIYILILPMISLLFSKNGAKLQSIVLFWGVLFIYLLLVLKANSVGIDINGYSLEYDRSKNFDFFDFSNVYYESGYNLLQKVFAKIGCSFQLFTGFIYTLYCYSLYKIISTHSEDASLSLLIYVCYQGLVFSISALRQTMATSLCILSFLSYEKKNARINLNSLFLFLLACSIHYSASICIFIFIIYHISQKKTNINFIFYSLLIIFGFVGRKLVFSFINKYIRSISLPSNGLGGNFIFLIIMTIFLCYSYFASPIKNAKVLYDKEMIFQRFSIRVSLVSVFLTALFYGSIMQRATMYFSFFLIVSIPNAISKFNKFGKILYKVFFVIFFIVLFYFETIKINQFNIGPYVFFWNNKV